MMIRTLLPTAALMAGALAASKSQSRPPNVLFILTDDQDWHMESLQHMPLVQKHLVDEGTVYASHFCTVALCCPSRVNLWTGRAAHNTNVTDVLPPYGGYPKIVQEGIDHNHLQVWMQDEGYNTYYTGKLYNAHSVDNYDTPPVSGFNGSEFLLDPYTYQYFNASMTRNGAPPVSYEGQYSPDVVFAKARGFLEEARRQSEPWFLTVAPIAPHSEASQDPANQAITAPQYAKRHAHLFNHYQIPRTSNFNPEQPSGAGWIKNLPRLNDTVIAYNDEYQRARLRALQSVDEGVESLVNQLTSEELENTYIFYTTDNGFHLSQHRLFAGKQCGFDTDIRIPLIVRGPGIAAGRVTDAVTSHTDLAPTILQLAGATKPDFDGAPIPIHPTELANPPKTEHVNIEFWGEAIPEGIYGNYSLSANPIGYGDRSALNNTYKGLRLIGGDYSLYYSVWCNGDREYYDVNLDAGQTINYFDPHGAVDVSTYRLFDRQFEDVVPRLDALIMVLKSCQAETCQKPWNVLHPDGDVAGLEDALAEKFDAFYDDQPKVHYTQCEPGYIISSEGPQDVDVYGGGSSSGSEASTPSRRSFEYTGHWSFWT